MILEKILKHFSKDGITDISVKNLYGRYIISLEIGDPDDEDTAEVTIDGDHFSCDVDRSEYGKSREVALDEISNDLSLKALWMVKRFSVERSCEDDRIHVLIETVHGSKVLFIITKWNEAVRAKMHDMYIEELSNGSYLSPTELKARGCAVEDDYNCCITMVSENLAYTINMVHLGQYLINMVEYFEG